MSLRRLPGCAQKPSRRMPGHSGHPLAVPLDVCHWLVTMATRERGGVKDDRQAKRKSPEVPVNIIALMILMSPFL